MKPKAYLEIATLFEDHWTGIPTVTAGIALAAIRDADVDWKFCYGSVEIPRGFLISMLEARSGKNSFAFLRGHVWKRHDISYEEGARSKAVFPHIKSCRGLFAEEAMFVHDLTPLLTPQFHSEDNVDSFADRIAQDVATSSRFFCNSRATRDDLVSYLRVDPAQTTVVQMGVDLDLFDVAAGQDLHRSVLVEPYIVVLGTLEPRKNGSIVLKYIARNPSFSDRFRIVFVGREGWLAERARLLETLASAGVSPDRVVFTGFVSDAEKVGLLLNCQFCVYASLYEGYGLPIAEAAALGKLVVCSDTSSMPEVAPDMCYFFDPTNLDEFGRAMSRAAHRAGTMRIPQSLSEIACRLQELRWGKCYEEVAAWVKA